MEMLEFPFPMEGAKTVLVTGGGRGLGKACAFQFAMQGYRVGVVARSLEEVDEVAGAIHAGGGISTSAVCDVSNEDSVAFAVESVEKRLGPVSVLINNAGQAASVPFSSMTVEQWRRMLDVNLTGTFLMSRALLPGMVTRGFGRIINVASTAGLKGFRYTAHYCASKHGVVGLTRALALEVAHKGITVNAVCPGWVETDMLAATVQNIASKTGTDEDGARALLLKGIPTKRFVSPASVASMVSWLASEGAKDMTGAALTMDGGETA